MHLESVTESANVIKKEVPGLSDVAKELASVLKKSRFFLNKLFDIFNKKEYSIDLTPEEQNEISLKVALVTAPDQVFQYARIVQLVFQLNYFAKCYDKALKSNILPSVVSKEAKSMFKKIEGFRNLIEKEYVSSI